MTTFMKDKNTTTKMMFHVIIALIPIIVFSFYKNGVMPYLKGFANAYEMFYPIIFIAISTLSTLIFETIYQLIFNEDKNIKNIICNSYSYMPGLFLGLILPINTPISIVLVGAFFASIIGKMIFGGFGKNIFNPALLGKLIVISSYSSIIMQANGYLNPMEVDTISSKVNTTIIGIGTYNDLVAPYGNLWDFFIGTIPGAIGETSSLLCIVAFIYLTITKTIKWRIPVCYIATVFIMSLIIALCNDTGIWYPIFQILSGGLMFGAVFMATDPVTSPITKSGQLIYGILLGIVTVVLRHLTPHSEEVLTSILALNLLIPIIDSMGIQIKFKNKKIITPLVILIILMVTVSFGIANKKDDKVLKNSLLIQNTENDYRGE